MTTQTPRLTLTDRPGAPCRFPVDQPDLLVWLAAAIPDFAGGSSFADQIAEGGALIAGDEWRSYGRQSVADPVLGAYLGFHDCDLETLRSGLTTLRMFYPAAVYAQPAPSAPPEPPSTFVLPTQDRTLRPDWLRTMARERLGIEPVEIDGGHFPRLPPGSARRHPGPLPHADLTSPTAPLPPIPQTSLKHLCRSRVRSRRSHARATGDLIALAATCR